MTNHWTPIRLGDIELAHRLAMAPMTRDRSAASGAPTATSADYYAQRASMGLVITEGTQPSEDGQGYLLTPGIYTEQHVAGWRAVTRAVRDAGGHVFIQLMHVGRIAHSANTPHHRQPVAPSAIKSSGKMFTAAGMLELPEPRALSTEEVAGTVLDFVHAAKSAVAAGADGVEIHGANGYLVHQFLSSNANRRTDPYGGSVRDEAKMIASTRVASAPSARNDEAEPEPMTRDSVDPVTCSGCGALFDRQAWVLLVLVERIGPANVRRMLLRWSDEFCIEVRRCGRCARQIAAKRHAPAEQVLAM